LDERPWYSGFFDHDYLRVFGPVLPEERTLTLAEVARVLAPGGRFLLEVANREALVRGWHDSDVTRHDDGLVVLQERTLDLRTSRDLVRYTLLHPDGRRTSHDTSIRLYTLTELAAMVDRAGLELLAVSGDLDGGPLELDSSFVVALSGRAGKGIS
jgi:SAM-dependent methyltransferase